jgi:hypothetical protein
MKNRPKSTVVITLIVLCSLLAWIMPGSAQEELPSRHVLELQFTAAPTEPPTFEDAGDVGIFKINPVGTVTGDLEGAFSQHITQVDPVVLEDTSPVNLLIDITTFFTIETEEGVIEGYYTGAFYNPEAIQPDVVARQHGQVLSVTAAYADLYLADVYYEGTVDFEEVDGEAIALGDSGTIVIAPR